MELLGKKSLEMWGAMGKEVKYLLPHPHPKFKLNAIGSSRLTGIIR